MLYITCYEYPALADDPDPGNAKAAMMARQKELRGAGRRSRGCCCVNVTIDRSVQVPKRPLLHADTIAKERRPLVRPPQSIDRSDLCSV
jgi:hypothetical protein